MAREASAERNTKETEIKLKINLDGTGYSDIETGVGFFNHMLDGFTRHGLFDLSVRVHGDLQVDDHHTIEDTGIVLGTALKEAIGDKKGIKRYGSCILPMDESLVLCAIDLSGRPLKQMQVRWNRQYKKQRMSFPMNQNMMEGVLRSAWDAFYFFAIACVLSENQLKLVLESHRLVIEFSHRKF